MNKLSERLCNVEFITTDVALIDEKQLLEILCESLYSILNKTKADELVA